jgi:hypothetical protein
MTGRINTPLRNYFIYKMGEKINTPLVGGTLKFWRNNNVSESGELTVYKDPDLTNPYTNPIVLDSDGGCPPVYMQDAAYYIECRSAEGALQFTLENYTGAMFDPGTNGDPTNVNNIFVDGQFFFGNFSGETSAGVTPITQSNWLFEKDGSSGSDNLQFIKFPLGDEDVTQTPIYMLNYKVTSLPSGETVKRYYQNFKFVRTLEDSQVTISFYGRATGAISVTPFYEQYFGSGGSPSTTNTVALDAIPLTGSWVAYSKTFVIDSCAGKSLGTNEDDFLSIGLNLPVNSLMDIYITNMLLQEGATATQYPFRTYEESQGELQNNPTGMLSYFSRFTAPIGWLECDGSEKSRTTYVNLYNATSVLKSGSTTSGSGVITGINTTNLRPKNIITFSGTTISGAATVTGLPTTLNLFVGMKLISDNIASEAEIVSIDSATEITISENATASSSVNFTFFVDRMELTSDNFDGIVYIESIDSETQITVSADATDSGTIAIRFYANGAGDGVNTFNVPLINSKVLVGANGKSVDYLYNTVGSVGGEFGHQQALDELIEHTHIYGKPEPTTSDGDNSVSSHVFSDTHTEPAGSANPTPINVVQPSYVGLICIKY